MKRISLAASLLIFGGISMVASSAQAQVIDVPFVGNQADTCTITPPIGLTIAIPLQGTMALNDDNTEFSSLEGGGSSGAIALFCTGSFTANVDAGSVRNDGATGSTVFNVFDPGFNGDLSVNSVSGGLGPNLLNVDLNATTSDSQVIAAGEYDFIVPVTITAGS